MAKKPTVTTLQSGFNSTETLNANFEALRDGFDNTLSLDGSTPNAMEADLDLNGNNLIGAAGLLVNGTDYLAAVEAAKAAALIAQAAAETAETNAETAETNAESSETAAGLSATAAATSATASAASAVDATNNGAAQVALAAAQVTLAETAKTGAELAETNAETAESNAATSATNAATSETNASTSASTASTKASEAATSATNAANSATAASLSKTAAATSESNASTSETNAATSETSAATSATTATTKASEASTSATGAATSETNAATSATTATTKASEASTSETNAATSASTATTKASEAATSATNSATSATESETAKTAAEAAKDAALAALDSFDDRYLGAKASDPTLDNDGNALISGALYFNTSDDVMKVYEGSSWVAAYASLSGALLQSNNLSDLADAAAARTNLGLGTAATTASTAYATAAQGDLADTATQPADLATVATTGAYLDLTGRPTLGTAAATASTDYATAAQGTLADSAVQPNDNPTFAGLTTTANVSFGDNDKAIFGAGSDLQIYHSGSNSFVKDVGQGNLLLDTNGSLAGFTSDGVSKYMALFNKDASVDLFYNNSKKLATTSTGVSITGALTLSGTVDGRDVAADGTKLDGIEAGATSDQTAAQLLTAIKTVDGAGSGLDADTLDGLDESTFMRRSANSGLDMNNNNITDVEDIYLQDKIYHDGDTNTYIQFHAADQWRVVTGGAERFEVNNSQITSTEPIHAPSFHGDGSSLTGIAAGAGGGGSDEIFWENGQNVTSNYTITNGKNAMSAGPITINSGVTVTVGAGETWTVV